MNEALANANAGMAGLIIFLIFFVCVLAWAFRPSAKEAFQKFGDIPLKDE